MGQPLSHFVVHPSPALIRAGLQTPPGTASHAQPWHLRFDHCQIKGQTHLQLVQAAEHGKQWVGIVQVTDVLPAEDPADHQRFIAAPSQLTQLTWNIRRTLDLDTIWQQTLEGLTQIFSVAWGAFCSYEHLAPDVVVVATTPSGQVPPPLTGNLPLAEYPSLQMALQSKQPITAADLAAKTSLEKPSSLLIAACRHQNEPNGVIVLAANPDHNWQGLDQALFQEVADQVGTAIAHAHLFRDAQGLADELQAANQRLRQKHRELEEARHQAEEASRLKSEFLANTSHELRTPLNGMIGFLRLILDGMADDPEEQQEFLQEAHKSAIHLLNLINDVLDIAKIEAGKMQIDMAQVNLRELFADLENFTRPQAEQKGLQFEINLPPTRDEIIVNGNYQRLLQVMLNLVGNAIKFTHEGSITISAEIKSQKVQFQDQEWPGIVKVSVADTGIGVSLEKQDRLFQTFSQVDGERTRQYGGTGLGLAISQRLVEAMGGVVQFISMGEGLGSTVTFTTLLYQEPVLIE
jgi:signal transduction histidine kinase